MRVIGDIPVCGEPVLENALEQIQNARRTCDYAALMADHHHGYSVPIGGVIASQDLVSPSAVGYDIACGCLASRLDIPPEEVRANIGKIMDDIVRDISFGIGRKNQTPVDDPLFDDPAWTEVPALKTKEIKERAQDQLGTVGGGNHYVDIMLDEQDRVWVGVHFGSRGLGHHIASHFMSATGQSQNDLPSQIPADSDMGQQYLRAMNLAGTYAYAGREAVVDTVASLMGARRLESVHNHHNFAWRETHHGKDYWVCRKGATPAFPGQKGFVGGSMGDDAVIVEGVDSADSQALLYSTVHGAGRVMSRTQAKGRSRWGKQRREPGILKADMDEWLRQRGVVLRGADVDEAPQAYKRLSEVLQAQGDTIRVLHTLRPVGVAMAGPETFDPYKD